MSKNHLTVKCIKAGIITCVDMSGTLKKYRQRGIQNIPQEKRVKLISLGLLDSGWSYIKELPKEYSIRYENETELGKASATYPKLTVDRLICNVDE